ncbi:MAG: hypothetical protein J1F35_03750 [Erysipelotrichales bacterium]|nr:hypothetical protein [Erysipelotrichales bacterium]
MDINQYLDNSELETKSLSNSINRKQEFEPTILTNGSSKPNEHLGASGENYYEMKDRISSLGSMKELLKDYDLVKSIIAYNGDRHFFAAFIELVNEAIAKDEIWADDLDVFKTGEVADAIVNMKETARVYGHRNVYPSEVSDKLNYLSQIKDANSFAASFTHPQILQAFAGNGRTDLTSWTTNSEIPVEGFATLISELLGQGSIDSAKEYLSNISHYTREYVTKNQRNGFSLEHSQNVRVLTNGTRHPNEYLGASGEDYYEMKERIKSFGPMKEILNNHDLVKSIIAYNGDRHFFSAFIDLVNEALAKHEIWSDDLDVFKSGEVADAIVNIKATAVKYGNRNAYPSELSDKLNYLSQIKDGDSFAASFTHPEILAAMIGNGSSQLKDWSRNSHKPSASGFAAIVYEMLEAGAIEAAKDYVDKMAYHSKKYSQAKHAQPSNVEFSVDELMEELDQAEAMLDEAITEEPNVGSGPKM